MYCIVHQWAYVYIIVQCSTVIIRGDKMEHELKYGMDFDDAWDALKKDVKKEMCQSNCIDSDKNIIWPCWLYIVKREKESMFKH